jgi:hypothetical protein
MSRTYNAKVILKGLKTRRAKDRLYEALMMEGDSAYIGTFKRMLRETMCLDVASKVEEWETLAKVGALTRRHIKF